MNKTLGRILSFKSIRELISPKTPFLPKCLSAFVMYIYTYLIAPN